MVKSKDKNLAPDDKVFSEELLRKSEERYREIFNNIQDTFYITNFEGIILDISPSIENISGYNREELIGKPILTIYSDNDGRKKLLDELVINGYTNDYEVTIKSKNNEFIRCSVASKMIFDEEQDPVKIVGSIRKIEERKRAEEALVKLNEQLDARVKSRTAELARSEELYLTTVNSINDLIFVLDQHFNIIFANDALHRFLQKNGVLGELQGKDVRETLFFLDEEEYNNFNYVFSKGKDHYKESEYIIFGKSYVAQRKISPIFQDNQVIRIVITMHDITDIKKIEEDIRKNLEREKELNILKSRFISTVSHEFRTPLAGIHSSVQLLQRYGEKWDIEKKEKMYIQISEAVNHTRRILEEVSLIDKEQSGRLYFKPCEINLKQLLNQVIEEMLQIYGENYKVDFFCELSSDTQFMDPEMIRRIFNNLLSNSIKYCGKIPVVQLYVSENSTHDITLIVKDSGIGIPEPDLKNIFEPFHRASNVEGIQGTGFGMSVVKRLVDFHMGKISVESVLGEGTKVTVVLPGISKLPENNLE